MTTVSHDIEHYLDAARDLAIRVAAEANRIDADRQIPAELAGELADQGFFRLLLPRSLGGAELSHPDFRRILEVFAAADGSTGWCINQNNVFSTDCVRIPEETAREIWGEERAVVTNGPPLPPPKRYQSTAVTNSATTGISAAAAPTPPGSRR